MSRTIEVPDWFPDDMVEDVRSHVRGARPADGVEEVAIPPEGWTCFHCGENFKSPWGARLHFGAKPDEVPACWPPGF